MTTVTVKSTTAAEILPVDIFVEPPVFNEIASDNVIDFIERADGVVLSGAAYGDVVAVTLVLNDIAVTADVVDGRWAYQLGYDEYPNSDVLTIAATAVDINGNTSEVTVIDVMLNFADVIAPEPPTFDDVASDNVIDSIEREEGVVLSGSASGGAVAVMLVLNDNVTVTADVVDGTWSYSLGYDEYPNSDVLNIAATAVDDYGNTSEANFIDVELNFADVIAPEPPTIDYVTGDNVIDSNERADGIVLTGSTEEGSNVLLRIGDNEPTEAMVDGTTWAYELSYDDYPDSDVLTIAATAIDGSGNMSEESVIDVTLDFVDDIAPEAPTFSDVTGDNFIDSIEREEGVVLFGTTEPNATVVLVFAEGEATIGASEDGTWEFALPTDYYPVDSDVLTVEAAAIDAAGNESEYSIIEIGFENIEVVPTYKLNVNKTATNESGKITFTLETTNVDTGTIVPFSLGGSISDADVTGGLPKKGFVVGSNGKASLSVSLRADKLTESVEDLTLTLLDDNSQTATISISDSSVSAVKPQYPHTGTVSISGSGKAQQGVALSVSSTMSDANGMGQLSYQWLKNGSPIKGATQATYTPNESDVGKAINVKVSYTDGLGKLETQNAVATGLVQPKMLPIYEVSVDTTTVNEGDGDVATFTLTTKNVAPDTTVGFKFGGSISDADVLGGLPERIFTVDENGMATLPVNFKADNLAEGVENLTLTLVNDSSKNATVSVNDTSIPFNINHPHTGTVSINPNAQQGETLSVTSTLKDVDGMGKLSYQWLKNGSPIKNATKATYTPNESDVGKAINVKVSYTDGLGKIESQSSATTLIQPLTLTPSYQLTVNKTAVNETNDNTATFTLTTENVAPNTEVYFKFDGTIKNADVVGGLPATFFTVDDNGIATLPISFNADKLTEKTEKLSITLLADNAKSATISVKDTSVADSSPDNTGGGTKQPDGGIPGVNKTATDPSGDKLVGDGGNDTLTGLTGDDELIGDAGSDVLNGEFGNDTLDSGNGNDTLTGGDGNDSLQAGSDNDFLDGGNGDDTLFGEKGNDTLQGGSGSDKMDGGAGDDYYYVDSAKDKITEADKSGIDSVETSLAYSLPDNFENLKLIGSGDKKGTGNKEGNVITGNDDDNVLIGNAGNDKLIGGGGADDLDGGLDVDTLVGGDGDDIYRINNLQDTITEDKNGGELDQIIASVDYSLESSFVEVLTLSSKAVNGTGNNLNNLLQELTGGKIANVFNGKGGDDTLEGGLGNDTLEGGEGNDIIDGGDGIDTVIFNGAMRDYQIKKNPDASGVPQIKVKYVGNLRDGESNEGTDILTNVEVVQFASGDFVNVSVNGDIVKGASSSQAMQIVELTGIIENIYLS